MAADPYLWALALLPAWAVLVGWPVRSRGEPAPAMTALGYLRRGPHAAIRTAVVDLHAGGLVEVAGPGGIARSRAAMRSARAGGLTTRRPSTTAVWSQGGWEPP